MIQAHQLGALSDRISVSVSNPIAEFDNEALARCEAFESVVEGFYGHSLIRFGLLEENVFG